jgi:hypothetical protein
VKSLVNGPIPSGAGVPCGRTWFSSSAAMVGRWAERYPARHAGTFHGDLARLGEQLAAMCGMAAESMRRASRALLTADLQLAERVLAS